MNWLAILGAAAVGWILGGVWFGVLGKVWMQEVGLKKEECNPKNPFPYMVAFIGTFLNAWALAYLSKALAVGNIVGALMVGGALWFFFLAANSAKHYAFSGRSLKLFGIDYGVDLLSFLAMSVIVFYWS